ncbi:MAG: hypothetical protein SPI34_07790 [Opitutales bacterium]|nr:hypothetical protein [Opitutales bacterium]
MPDNTLQVSEALVKASFSTQYADGEVLTAPMYSQAKAPAFLSGANSADNTASIITPI